MSAGYVYLFRLGEFHKIGRSADVAARATAFSSMPHGFAIVHHFFCNDSGRTERQLHARYADCRAAGEWFRLSEEQVEHVCSLQDEPATNPAEQEAISGESGTVHVKLRADRYERLSRTARGLGLSPSDLVRMILALHLGEYDDRADENISVREEFAAARRKPD
jgi:hypothetical protein